MTSLQTYRNKAFVEDCHQTLLTFSAEVSGVETVILATVDGFEITSTITQQAKPAEQLSAVGSSLYALASSLVSEFDLTDCQALTINSENGRVYIREISAEDNPLILIIKANKTSLLANILHGANKLAERIRQRVRQLA